MHLVFAVLCTACASAAVSLSDALQLSFDTESSHPDFDLDLNASRLVQMEAKAPVWMTELEKVSLVLFPFFWFRWFSLKRARSSDPSQGSRHPIL
jgi:hypothetical protein